jgi:hypothetical protein
VIPVTEIPASSAARLVRREELSPGELEKMYSLLDTFFRGVSRERFHRDIAEKNWVLLLERAERIVGFSTILVYETRLENRPCSVVYSGDTIVAPEAWNSSALPRAWIESVARLRGFYPRGPYLWLLIASGFRTYRFLPLFWREFFPRFDQETAPHWKRGMDQLAGERFGSRYDPAAGTVRFECPQRLREAHAGIPPGRLSDPHVAFFATRNPGHGAGDELVCLTELSPRNLTAAGRRAAAAVPEW